ncbi:MAG: ketol-acid reductoisomerase [Candidatus Micrarchaeota archaeon]
MVKEIKDASGKLVAKLIQEQDIPYTYTGTLAVIGYASQGRGQALCHRDSGTNVVVGLRKNGESWKQALADNWVEGQNLLEIPEAVKRADAVQILITDTQQAQVYKESIEPNLKKGATLIFSHGFNIHFKLINPPADSDVIMIAPKGPGRVLRAQYESGFGIPALTAVHQNPSGKARENVLALAKAIGCARAGLFETTFKDEVETDLFGEQVDLCGGVTAMVQHTFDTLVEAGYNPLLAYFETSHELYGLIAPMGYKRGNAGVLAGCSETARYGGITCGPKVMDEHVKDNMKKVLTRIQNGEFVKEYLGEYKQKGRAVVDEPIARMRASLIGTVGTQVRKSMWPDDKEVE